MYIVKVRDRITEEEAELIPEPMRSLLLRENNKWKTCILAYKSEELARDFVNRQRRQAKRFSVARDYRVFEKNGRKLTLVWEI